VTQAAKPGTDRVSDVYTETADTQVRQCSEDGLVTATVDPRGQLTSLELDPRLCQNGDAVALAATITETVQRAADSAAVRIQGMVGGYLSVSSGAVDYLRDALPRSAGDA